MTIRILNFADGFTSSSQPGDILGYYKTYAVETILAAGEISCEDTFGFQRRPVVGDGPVTTSLTPFGTSGTWFNGVVVTLIGSSAVNTVTIPFNDNDYGTLINGSMTLGDGHSIPLQWDNVRLRWFEIGRNI